MRDTGLYGYVYNFSDDYDSIDADDISNVHKYLKKKQDLLKKVYLRF